MPDRLPRATTLAGCFVDAWMTLIVTPGPSVGSQRQWPESARQRNLKVPLQPACSSDERCSPASMTYDFRGAHGIDACAERFGIHGPIGVPITERESKTAVGAPSDAPMVLTIS